MTTLDDTLRAFEDLKNGTGGRNGHGNGHADDVTPPLAITIALSDVVAQPLDWLWPGRIPFGKLTLLAGDPGLGKSFASLDIASRLSTGTPLPDEDTTTRKEPITTLLLNVEDGLDDTVRPRLDALGADCERVVALTGVKDRGGERLPHLGSDLSVIEEAVERHGARLLIIDPINAYVGGTDAHKDVEMRVILTPLAVLAARLRIAIVAVTHANKGAADANPLHRVMGSLAYVAAARSVLGLGTDPDDLGRRVLVQIKSNLAALTPNLAFRVVEGRVQWDHDPVSTTAQTVFAAGGATGAAGQESKALSEAMDFLMTVLAHGRQESRAIFAEAREIGISQASVRRAQVELGVRAFRTQFAANSHWYWELPNGDSEGAHVS